MLKWFVTLLYIPKISKQLAKSQVRVQIFRHWQTLAHFQLRAHLLWRASTIQNANVGHVSQLRCRYIYFAGREGSIVSSDFFSKPSQAQKMAFKVIFSVKFCYQFNISEIPNFLIFFSDICIRSLFTLFHLLVLISTFFFIADPYSWYHITLNFNVSYI